MNEIDIDAALRKLPAIRRARFWRLYAENGKRFLDFWQDGGRGILGARHAKLGLGLKATIDRGLDRPLPSRLEARLAKAALALAPGMEALRLFRNEERALAALAGLGGDSHGSHGSPGSPWGGSPSGGGSLLDSPLVFDPARIGPLAGSPIAGLIRALATHLPSSATSASSYPVAIPLLPLPRGLGPTILLFEDEAAASKVGNSDLVAPLALRAALDALTALADYEARATEALWRRIDRRVSHLFDRRGPWLFPKSGIGDWARIFDAALDRGLLLSPDPGLPSIIPGDFDDGEVARFTEIVP